MDSREERNRFYQRKAWKDVRDKQLLIEPTCRLCRQQGRYTRATVVDHIIKRSSGGSDYDPSNLQSICKACHDGYKQRLESSGVSIGCKTDGSPIDRQHHWNVS